MCVKGGRSISSFFYNFKRGTQGGILSPKLFSMYMNGLTDELSNSYAGCYINPLLPEY